MELSQRKGKILRAVVLEYVMQAEPVASNLISEKHGLGVRSATIRNELSEITSLGFLEQPHTSAGRIPSQKGYRYYVDHLRLSISPKKEEKTKITLATNKEETTRELLRATAKAVSRCTQLLCAAVSARNESELVRNVVVTALSAKKVLMVLLLHNGHSVNKILECPAGLSLDDLGWVNEKLNSTLSQKTLYGVAKTQASLGSDQARYQLLNSALSATKSIATDLTRGHLILEGEEFIFAQPEFRQSEMSLRDLSDSLSQETDLIASLSKATSTISIGSENEKPQYSNLSFIKKPIYVGNQDAGVISIIGPMRMDYDRNESILDFASSAVSQTLTQLYGS